MEIKAASAFDFTIPTSEGIEFKFTNVAGASKQEAIEKLTRALNEVLENLAKAI